MMNANSHCIHFAHASNTRKNISPKSEQLTNFVEGTVHHRLDDSTFITTGNRLEEKSTRSKNSIATKLISISSVQKRKSRKDTKTTIIAIMSFAPTTTTMVTLFYYSGLTLLGLAILIPVILVMVTVVLTAITSLRWSSKEDDEQQPQNYESSFCTGRVMHMRYQPAIHGFSYPMFFSFINVKEIPKLFGTSSTKGTMWPLSMLVTFQEDDHLKNGEGFEEDDDKKDSSSLVSFEDRIYRLLSQRTQGKFTPNTQTHSIHLLTHLSYYGYCFNPVSFYYILNKDKNKTIDAIVAEVSNTPWNEMYCYVLHPKSIDMTSVTQQQKIKASNKAATTTTTTTGIPTVDDEATSDLIPSWNYIFPKKFHVSPFMEMDLIYDWTFEEVANDKTHNKIQVSTTLLRQDNGTKQFHASFHVTPLPKPLNPWQICKLLLMYPIYCAIVQIWIHYEAFWLFVKGVVFIDHPEGSETTASRIIGTIMTPLFALKDWINDTFTAASSNKQQKDNNLKEAVDQKKKN